MNRIKTAFDKCLAEKRKALVIYLTMGCPDLSASEKYINSVIDGGADIIELGVPFSDPMADGEVIQESARRALTAGTTLKNVIKTAGNIRKRCDNPMILFSYYNVLLAYGIEKLAADAEAAGIDGLLVVDLPFEHSNELEPALKKHGLSMIPLIAPTTSLERAEKIMKDADGFIYSITSKGVTGGKKAFDSELEARMNALRATSPVPVVAGFGIDSPEKAAKVKEYSDGVVIGSAAMRIINDSNDCENASFKLEKFTRDIAKVLKSD